MSISTLIIFLAGFLGGLYVLRLIFEKPEKKNTNSKIKADGEETYSFGSEDESATKNRTRSSS